MVKGKQKGNQFESLILGKLREKFGKDSAHRICG